MTLPIHHGIAPVTREQLGLPPEEPVYTVDGKTRTLEQWARQAGMPVRTLRNRLYRGLTMAEALAKPYAPRRR